MPPGLRPPPWPEVPDENLLGDALVAWAQACPRPLALFFDEIDSLSGQSLISVLSQLREGYDQRPDGFPASVALCGLRDVRAAFWREHADVLTSGIVYHEVAPQLVLMGYVQRMPTARALPGD